MNGVRTTGSRLLAWIAAACLALCMAVLALPATAQADDEAVRADRSGVLKFNWSIDNEMYAGGSCFLINDDTVVTAYHCTMFATSELDRYGFSGMNVAELRDRTSYSVTIERGVQVGAKLINWSEDQDFAILKLDQSLNGHTPLKLRDSSKVDGGDPVYSLGFPADADRTKVLNTYTADDVTIRQGNVVKAEGHYSFSAYDFDWNGIYLQTSCPINSGDSGGPMVDSSGNVVGISVAGGDGYYYASASDGLMSVLKTLGIEFTEAPGPGPNPSSTTSSSSKSTENALDFSALNSAISAAKDRQNQADSYSDGYNAKLQEALDAANEAKNLELEDSSDNSEYTDKQAKINEAASNLQEIANNPEEKAEIPIAMIIGIVVAVIAVIAIIVVLVLRNRKKGDEAASATDTSIPASGTVPVPPSTPAPMPEPVGKSKASSWSKPGGGSSSEATIVDSGDSAETVVGGGDSGETVVQYQAVHGGTLTRMSTNDKIEISNANFTIGRQRGKVDYQLEGDSISRVHARIEVHEKDGAAYIVDNNSANGTYVNGVKLRAGVEQQLKDGDIIKISDEKFKYSK